MVQGSNCVEVNPTAALEIKHEIVLSSAIMAPQLARGAVPKQNLEPFPVPHPGSHGWPS